MPAAATPGATRATYGVPVPRVARIPATSTTAVAVIHPISSDGVVTSARATPGERSSPPPRGGGHPPVHQRRGAPPPRAQPGRAQHPPCQPLQPARLAPPHLRGDPEPHPAQGDIGRHPVPPAAASPQRGAPAVAA